jgi:hypothetical protein
MKQTSTGGCQCGVVRCKISAAIREVLSCNCSRRNKLGWLVAIAAPDDFKLISGDTAAKNHDGRAARTRPSHSQRCYPVLGNQNQTYPVV